MVTRLARRATLRLRGPPDDHLAMSTSASTTWAVTAGSLAYATLRYNILKGVPWTDWPVFVLNKALALSSLLLLVLWTVRARRGRGAPQAVLLAAASRMALAHVGLSLVVLTPVYFPAFFLDGRLTWQAGTAVALGVAAASGLAVGARHAGAHGYRLLALGLVAFGAGAHAALYGYSSWLTPSAWPGYLPPITLIAFAAGIFGMLAAVGGPSGPPVSR